jgi:hypothetical protein
LAASAALSRARAATFSARCSAVGIRSFSHQRIEQALPGTPRTVESVRPPLSTLLQPRSSVQNVLRGAWTARPPAAWPCRTWPSRPAGSGSSLAEGEYVIK